MQHGYTSNTLDLDHTDDATYASKHFLFTTPIMAAIGYLPLLVFEAHSGAW
jgi:hypothetical protein